MSRLVQALAALPDAVLVPVGWVRAALADTAPPLPAEAPDLDVAAFARLVGRSPATVRAWCERGLVPGAYHLPASGKVSAKSGRPKVGAWRVPLAAVAAFRARGAELSRQDAPQATISTPADTGTAELTDVPRIGDWRQYRKRGRGRRT